MDLLYSKYSNPLEFMNLYFEQGRLGEFIGNIVEKENERRKMQAEKDNEDKLFMLYAHSFSDKSFNEWKREVLRHGVEDKAVTKDIEMTDDDIIGVIDHLFAQEK